MNMTQHEAWQVLTKVPKLTIYFWIIKIITTALGEATSDYLVNTISPYIAVGLGFILLVIMLAWQLTTKKYTPAIYWLTALAVSIAGTMGADVVHVGFGIPYAISTAFYTLALAAAFTLWYRSEKTLSIHSIYTKKRESFYWLVILLTFALGTAAGDLTAFTFNLGFLLSGILFTAIFAVPCLLYWKFKLNPIVTFWFAYIFTRPVGASFADWFGKPISIGGLGYGDIAVCAFLITLFVIFVAYVSITRTDRFSKLEG